MGKKKLSKDENSVSASSKNLINVICLSIGAAMGISVIVLNLFNKLDIRDLIAMLGLGLFGISIYLLSNQIDIKK